MKKHNLLPKHKGSRQLRVGNSATGTTKMPFGTGAKTVYSATSELTIKETALIQSAFSYRIMRHGVILLSVPAPIGYAVWVNNGISFISEAETFLSSNGIKEVEQ